MKTTVNQSGATITTSNSTISLAGIIKQFSRIILSSQSLTKLTAMVSEVLEQKVSPADVLRILNLCLSICFAVFPVDMPIILRLAAIAWMAKAVSAVRHMDLFKDED